MVEWFLVLLLLTVGVAIIAPVFRRASDHKRKLTGISNVKQQAQGLMLYREDYDRRHPLAETWMDAVAPYILFDERVYHDPVLESKNKSEFGYAYFRPLSGTNVNELRNPHLIPLTFQSKDLARNANGGLDLLPNRVKDFSGNCVSFVDGRAKYMPKPWPNGPITIVLDPSLAKEPGE